MPSLWTRWFSHKEQKTIDRYHIAAITVPEEMNLLERLPLEVRFVLTKRPESAKQVQALLTAGYGLGIRTVDHTPERILRAVDQVSRYSQHNTIIPWLPKLLRDEILPQFSKEELLAAEREGVNLYEEARVILERRFEFKKIVLIDLHNRGLGEDERKLIQALNEDLYPFVLDYIVNRIIFDNAHSRTEIAQSIIKALLIIGPIAHFLEQLSHGIGKIFAASTDDLLAEAAELFALRGSGFSWRVLAKRGRILVPVFILATWGAFSVEHFVQRGELAYAGLLFGCSAVALSLTTAIQSLGLYHASYRKLAEEKKIEEGARLWRLAFKQDFTNPTRLGLFIGALCAPLVAAFVFSVFPRSVYNGWVLALLGSVESIVAGTTVIIARRVNRWRFRVNVRRAMEQEARKRNSRQLA